MTTKPKGKLPNVQIMKLSNQSLPHGSDAISSIMNIFVRTCFPKKLLLPSIPNVFYNIFYKRNFYQFKVFSHRKNLNTFAQLWRSKKYVSAYSNM
jgi:hypothetical protein